MQEIGVYQKLFEAHLLRFSQKSSPANLYEPIAYLLSLEGKRLRPILALMAADCWGTDPKQALPAAQAVEIFHNFTLMHDDIMDAAPLRRGQATVHKKWDVNTAILSGDAMLIEAYQCLEPYSSELFISLTSLLSKTALEVCEGQQLDMDFSVQSKIKLEDYLEMIRLKTAVLVGCSLKMGALVALATEEEAQKIYDFGVLLGIAFQIQDDWLDVFGSQSDVGKKLGGDIVENKKTMLYHMALQKASQAQQNALMKLYEPSSMPPDEKIRQVLEIFEATEASSQTLAQVTHFTNEAYKCLDSLNIDTNKKTLLKDFGNWLMNRKH